MQKQKKTILLVEDNHLTRDCVRMILFEEYHILEAETQKEAVGFFFNKKFHIDLVILDLNLPDSDGPDGVSLFTRQFSDVPVIVMTMENDPHIAAEVIKRGADEYIRKNGIYDNEDVLKEKVAALIDQRNSSHDFNFSDSEFFFPETPEFSRIYLQAEMAVRESLSLLINGETGVGKSNLVKYLHRKIMPQKAFVEIDCGSINDNIMESELFGHKAGAFTDAKHSKKGLIEEADGGLLFMDEISNTSCLMQQRLLRVLQEGKLKNVGSSREKTVRFSLISAANEDLYEAVKAGRFRRDLLYRINEVEITIPPLRENPELIRQFIEHFLKVYNHKCGTSFYPDAFNFNELLNRPWEGNIRELDREIKRLVYFNYYGLSSGNSDVADSHTPETISFKEKRDDLERQGIIDALIKHKGNIKKTADFLKINRTTLYSRMKRLNVDKESVLETSAELAL